MRNKMVLATLGLFLLAALLPATAAAARPVKEAGPEVEVAVFAVPGLDDTLVKSLTKALAKEKGVVAAKADAEAGRFLVSFTHGKTTPEKLTQRVAHVAPEAKLEGVHAAAGKGGVDPCAGCPSRAKCAGEKPGEGEKK